jgi:hypothetical protein
MARDTATRLHVHDLSVMREPFTEEFPRDLSPANELVSVSATHKYLQPPFIFLRISAPSVAPPHAVRHPGGSALAYPSHRCRACPAVALFLGSASPVEIIEEVPSIIGWAREGDLFPPCATFLPSVARDAFDKAG